MARSADRRKKEEAMHRRFVERFEAALMRMQAQADSGRLKDLAVANRRLGRLAQQNWRASGAFDGDHPAAARTRQGAAENLLEARHVAGASGQPYRKAVICCGPT